jgi:hypothetical protein
VADQSLKSFSKVDCPLCQFSNGKYRVSVTRSKILCKHRWKGGKTYLLVFKRIARVDFFDSGQRVALRACPLCCGTREIQEDLAGGYRLLRSAKLVLEYNEIVRLRVEFNQFKLRLDGK